MFSAPRARKTLTGPMISMIFGDLGPPAYSSKIMEIMENIGIANFFVHLELENIGRTNVFVGARKHWQNQCIDGFTG